MNVLRVNLIAIVAVFGLIAAQPVHSQTTSVNIPFTSDPSYPLLCEWVGRVIISGNLHLTLKSSVDENGCMQYDIGYNTSNIDIDVTWGPGQHVSSGRMDGDDVTVTVCDENHCMVIFGLSSYLTFQVTDQWGPSGPSQPIVATCLIRISWNRCTDEWSSQLLHCWCGEG